MQQNAIVATAAAAADAPIERQDLFAPFEARPELAAEFINNVLRTNPENATMTANLSAIVARKETENLGTLLRNVINTHHLELSRGVFVFLRARGLLSASIEPPPTARDLIAKRKREEAAKAATAASEFNAQGELLDSHGKRIMLRTKHGNRYFYEHTDVMLPYHFEVRGEYELPDNVKSVPDQWCGPYFLDSYETPILYRSRSYADPAVIEYRRIIAADKLTALLDHDEDKYFKLVEADEQQVKEDAEDSEAEAEAEAEVAAEAEAEAEAEAAADETDADASSTEVDADAEPERSQAFDLRIRRITADKPSSAAKRRR